MKPLALTAALLTALFVLPARAEDGAAEDYARALDKENTDRDLNGAMEIYKSILKKHKDEEEIAAKAQYRIAECWEKLGVARDAKEAYEAVVRDFPAQAGLVEKAKERLAAIAGKPVEKNRGDIVASKLAKTRIDLDFQDSTLYDILDFVSQFGRVSCLVDPAAKELAEKQLTFAVKDLPLDKVLTLLAESAHVAWFNRNGILIWTTPARLNELKQLPVLGVAENAADDDREVAQALESIQISLNFTDTPIEETMSFIREVSQINIVLDQNLAKSSVTLRLEETSLRDVFELLSFLNKLDIRITEGAVVVKGK